MSPVVGCASSGCRTLRQPHPLLPRYPMHMSKSGLLIHATSNQPTTQPKYWWNTKIDGRSIVLGLNRGRRKALLCLLFNDFLAQGSNPLVPVLLYTGTNLQQTPTRPDIQAFILRSVPRTYKHKNHAENNGHAYTHVFIHRTHASCPLVIVLVYERGVCVHV